MRVTATVIEAGPVTVSGPGTVCEDQAVAAVDGIDDPIALIDEEPVAVDELWIEVIRRSAGASAERLIVVCPTWWTTEQLARIRRAAAVVTSDVVMMRRATALSAELPGDSWAVVECAVDLIMVSRGDAEPLTLIRHADIEKVARLVAEAAEGAREVTVDAPGDDVLGPAVVDQLLARGGAASLSDAASMRRAAACHAEPAAVADLPRKARRGKHAVGGALAAVAVCVAVAVRPAATTAAEHPMTLLVEGRVGMQVPAQWRVQRVTGGPGSDRVQVTSTTDPGIAVNLTQSATTGQSVADTLRRALAEQPAGVFVDFNPDDRIAGRSVVSYREVRADREIRWVVLADKAVRIAIGCQSAPGRGDTVQEACDAAVRSAHAVF